MTPSDDLLYKKAYITHWITFISLLLLLTLMSLRFLWLTPPGHPLTILAVHAAPLLCFIPGIIKRRPRVYIWLCFVLLLYFCQATIDSFRLPHIAGVIGLVQAILTSTIFCSAMFAARYFQQIANR